MSILAVSWPTNNGLWLSGGPGTMPRSSAKDIASTAGSGPAQAHLCSGFCDIQGEEGHMSRANTCPLSRWGTAELLLTWLLHLPHGRLRNNLAELLSAQEEQLWVETISSLPYRYPEVAFTGTGTLKSDTVKLSSKRTHAKQIQEFPFHQP